MKSNTTPKEILEWCRIPHENSHYKALIGTGGIGAGSLFLIKGNETLCREESRGGKYLDARDYDLFVRNH